MDVKQPTDRVDRLAGLRRFAVAITILNILGHTWFGFEQSFATPLVALRAGYSTELILELIDAWAMRRPLRIQPTFWGVVDFFLSAHITGLAVGMLLYANDRLWVVAFGVVVAIASKAIFRFKVGKDYKHFFNPSNLGITVVLLTFHWVGIVPPYHFTENLGNVGTWVLPGIIICSGTLLNALFTKRIPLAVAWVTAYLLQAVIRTLILGTPLLAGLVPVTGVAFLLFTFYMVTDPATTPRGLNAQIVFGSSVAFVYTMLVYLHIVFGMFFALTLVCGIRGAYLYVMSLRQADSPREMPAAKPLQPAIAAAIAEVGSVA
jgi:Na+-translocating ferredoxin:NAD+ oxidoreductase RnfD subunit